MSKKLLFITGTRADYGKLEPLAVAAQKTGFAISFFITGMHMMRRYGETRLEVRRFPGAEFFEFVNQREGDAQEFILSKTILGFSDFVHEHRPDLVIIQGSINDRAQGVAGYRDAVNAAWDTLAATYPQATIVVLGPAPHELPVGAATARIDTDLSALAAARGWWYISPIAQEWITAQNYLDVIDVEVGRKHPSTNGHRYLAERLAAALDELRTAPVTEAGGSESSPDE